MQTLWSYYDVYSRSFYNPRCGGKTVFNLSMPRLDWVRYRVAVTFGRAAIDPTTGIPAEAAQYDLSDYTASLFSLKSLCNYYAPASASKLDFTNSGGFDTTDTAWHNLSAGCFTLAPIVVPVTVYAQKYMAEIALLKPNSRWTLRPEDDTALAPYCYVQRDVYSGLESNAPSGMPGGIVIPFSITDANTSVTLSIPDITVNGIAAIANLPSSGGAGGAIFYQTPDAGVGLVISVDSAPGTGAAYNGVATILNL